MAFEFKDEWVYLFTQGLLQLDVSLLCCQLCLPGLTCLLLSLAAPRQRCTLSLLSPLHLCKCHKAKCNVPSVQLFAQ